MPLTKEELIQAGAEWYVCNHGFRTDEALRHARAVVEGDEYFGDVDSPELEDVPVYFYESDVAYWEA